jgi:hypothetical protein
MVKSYVYPISKETLSLVEDVLHHLHLYGENPFVGILLRELERECSPYNNVLIQEKLIESLNEVHRVEK